MKKKIAIALIAAMTLSMTATGCANGDKNATETVEDSKVKGEKVELDNGVIILGNYKGIEAELQVCSPTEADIDNWINQEIESYATEEEIDTVEDGCNVTIDLEVMADGSKLDDYSGEDITIIIGNAEYDEKLDEALIDKKKGNKFSVTVKYDDTCEDDNLAGKEVIYSGKVKDITTTVLPDVTEDFIKEQLGFDSEEEMRKSMKEDMIATYNEDYEATYQSDLIQKVMDASEVKSYDDEYLASTREDVINNYISYYSMFGIDSEDSLKETLGMTDADIDEEAKNLLTSNLVLQAIAKLEGIEISDDDYKDIVAQYAKDYVMTSDEFEETYGKEYLMEQFLYEKAAAVIEENAKKKEVKVSPSEEEEEQLEE